MKFAKYILTAALILPFFANAQDNFPPPDSNAPPAAPSMNDPALDGVGGEAPGQAAPPSTPASELGEKKAPKKKSKKASSKKSSKKSKKDSKKSKKSKKKKKHHSSDM